MTTVHAVSGARTGRREIGPEAKEVVDIGWTEGVLDDGRPFRLEFWCAGDAYNVTVFTPRTNGEELDDADSRALLEDCGLLDFLADPARIAARPFFDARLNEIWSINVVVHADDTELVRILVPLRKYQS